MRCEAYSEWSYFMIDCFKIDFDPLLMDVHFYEKEFVFAYDWWMWSILMTLILFPLIEIVYLVLRWLMYVMPTFSRLLLGLSFISIYIVSLLMLVCHDIDVR